MPLLSKMPAVKAGASKRRGEERRRGKWDRSRDRRGERGGGKGERGEWRDTWDRGGDFHRHNIFVFTSVKLFIQLSNVTSST